MIQTVELVARFESMQKEILDLLAERDRQIMDAESPRKGDAGWRPERLAEMKAERVKNALQVKVNSKERFTQKVKDFLSSIRTERTRRKYPLETSTSTENHRRSEHLTLLAERFCSSVGDNIDAFEVEFLAGEPEYQSRLIDWANLKNLFQGNQEAFHRFIDLDVEWRSALELKELDKLEKRVEGLQERIRKEYVLAENGIYQPAKDFREWELRMELLEKDQVREDESNSGLVPNLWKK